MSRSLLENGPLKVWYVALMYHPEVSVSQCSSHGATMADEHTYVTQHLYIHAATATPWQWHVALMPEDIL